VPGGEDELALLLERCGTDPFVAGPLVSVSDFEGWVADCTGIGDAIARLMTMADLDDRLELEIELVHVAQGGGRGVRLLECGAGRATFATELLGPGDRDAVLEDIARAVGGAYANVHGVAVREVVAAVYLGLGLLVQADDAAPLRDLQLTCCDDAVLTRLGLPARADWPERRRLSPAVPERAPLPRARVHRIGARLASQAVSSEAQRAVRCPHCGWRPGADARWSCSCGYWWDTFQTRGCCPRCEHAWRDTACLACEAYALHADWYG